MAVKNIINPFNAPVYYRGTVSSTMDISRELSQEGEPHGTVIMADFQEVGRGRIRDRKWEMEKDLNLSFTILLRYPGIERIPVALTLRAALTSALAIEDFLPCLENKVMIKWPNDLLINSKKIAGILCEADGGIVHLGIGINVAQKEFPAHLREKAASLRLAANIDISTDERYILLQKILKHISNELENCKDSECWKSSLEKRLYKKGEQVIFTEGVADSGRLVKGCLCGIGKDGELLILTDSDKKVRSFYSGELRW